MEGLHRLRVEHQRHDRREDAAGAQPRLHERAARRQRAGGVDARPQQGHALDAALQPPGAGETPCRRAEIGVAC